MAYNLTGLENNTNVYEVFTVVNTISGEWLVAGLLIILWIILFVAFKNYETITALRTSSLIVGVISLLFFSIGLLHYTYMMIPLLITGLTVFYSMIIQ